MTASISPELLLLPNEFERKQIFYLLKKHSSWTAWNRVLGFYQKWAEVMEESVRQADNNGLETSLPYSSYVEILKGLALFDEGVRRLAQGDKQVFTADEAMGLFGRTNAVDIVGYYQKAKWKLEDGDIAWEETTPLMKEFFEALDEFCSAKWECARYIVEHSDPEFNLEAKLSYGLWEMIFLPQLPFPKPLPDLPENFDVVEVKTGEMVPCSGIWEPIVGSTRVGTLNYLHGDTLAPQSILDYRDKNSLEHGYRCIVQDAAWRLIWRDDRYEDGTVPEEERYYEFLKPSPPEVENGFNYPGSNVVDYLRRHNLPNPLLEGVQAKDMRCEGGDVCPHDGNWWTPASQPGTGRFKKGDVMPDFPSSKYGATIWYRMKE